MTARVAQLNVSPGGVPKRPVERAYLGPEGLQGDAHNDRVAHGGPLRALCLYALERIGGLQSEGHPVQPGWLGENLTTSGLDWDAVRPGTRLRIGQALVEITRYTSPCRNIRGSFSDGDYSRVAEPRHPGWSRVYARVLTAGQVAQGDPIEIVAAGSSVH